MAISTIPGEAKALSAESWCSLPTRLEERKAGPTASQQMLQTKGLEKLLRQKASETWIDSPAHRTMSSHGLVGSGAREASTQDNPGCPQHLP